MSYEGQQLTGVEFTDVLDSYLDGRAALAQLHKGTQAYERAYVEQLHRHAALNDFVANLKRKTR